MTDFMRHMPCLLCTFVISYSAIGPGVEGRREQARKNMFRHYMTHSGATEDGV